MISITNWRENLFFPLLSEKFCRGVVVPEKLYGIINGETGKYCNGKSE